MMKEIKNEIKNLIIAQNGKLYNRNFTEIMNKYGCSVIDCQNAMNYFQFSPQQRRFREKYNFH